MDQNEWKYARLDVDREIERRDAETDMMIDYARRSRMSSHTASQVMLASQVMQPSRPASYQASWIEHSGASTLGEEMPGTRSAAAPRGTQYPFSARSHLDPPRAFLPEIPSPRSKTARPTISPYEQQQIYVPTVGEGVRVHATGVRPRQRRRSVVSGIV